MYQHFGCILARNGAEGVDWSVVYWDIMALVQLHPEDAAWKRVAESFMIWEKVMGGSFFNQQLV